MSLIIHILVQLYIHSYVYTSKQLRKSKQNAKAVDFKDYVVLPRVSLNQVGVSSLQVNAERRQLLVLLIEMISINAGERVLDLYMEE